MASLEQRQNPRYITDAQVQFYTPYDFRTEVDFGVAANTGQSSWQVSKYIGFSRNISVHGLCFESNKELKKDDRLWMELHLPQSTSIIYMQGIVRWSQASASTPGTPVTFLSGVEVNVVDGIDIDQTVYYDQKYSVFWSELLERVLGGFAKLQKKKPVIHVPRGILRDEAGRYLLLKRSSRSKTFPGQWEFPGGKVDAGEDIAVALRREFLEETGLDVEPQELFLEFFHDRGQSRVQYAIFHVRLVSGIFCKSDEHDAADWFSPDQLRTLDVSPPLSTVISKLIA